MPLWMQVSGGKAHTCAIDTHNELTCWGIDVFVNILNMLGVKPESGLVSGLPGAECTELGPAKNTQVKRCVSKGYQWLQV